MSNDLISWLGNKKRAAEMLWDYYGNINTFVDPFCGSAALIFERPSRLEGISMVINDMDYMLVNTLRALKWDYEKLCEEFDEYVAEANMDSCRIVLERLDYDEFRKMILSSVKNYSLPVAYAWLYLNNSSIHPIKMRGTRKSPIKSFTDNMKIVKGGQKLKRAVILSGDWERALSKAYLYIYKTNKERAGILLDPPYMNSESDYRVISKDIALQAYIWATENFSERIRIAYCCYDEDFPLPEGWKKYTWQGKTYSKEGETGARSECVMLSPHSECGW